MTHEHLIESLKKAATVLEDAEKIITYLEAIGVMDQEMEKIKEKIEKVSKKLPAFIKLPRPANDKARMQQAEALVSLHNRKEQMLFELSEYGRVYGGEEAGYCLREIECLWQESGMAEEVARKIDEVLPLYEQCSYISNVLFYVEQKKQVTPAL